MLILVALLYVAPLVLAYYCARLVSRKHSFKTVFASSIITYLVAYSVSSTWLLDIAIKLMYSSPFGILEAMLLLVPLAEFEKWGGSILVAIPLLFFLSQSLSKKAAATQSPEHISDNRYVTWILVVIAAILVAYTLWIKVADTNTFGKVTGQGQGNRADLRYIHVQK